MVTLDGSTPSIGNGTSYSAPLSISITSTLKAVAVKIGLEDSDVAVVTYTVYASPYNLKFRVPNSLNLS